MKPQIVFRNLLLGFALAILALVVDTDIRTYYHSFFAYTFELTLQSSAAGTAQLFFDRGAGFRETDSERKPVSGGELPQDITFTLQPGKYHALRLDPIDREASIVLHSARITDSEGHTLREFLSEDFQPIQQLHPSSHTETMPLTLSTAQGANDPILHLKLEQPFSVQSNTFISLWMTVRAFPIRTLGLLMACLTFAVLLPFAAYRFRERFLRLTPRLRVLTFNYPQRSIAVAAFLAATLSCYPVVFFGKSFLSPNNGVALLYNSMPSLPGYSSELTENAMGSDLGAMMWAHWPYSVVQYRAITRDFELPLWNRFNSLGVTLLGQGQSMIADPLHIIVLAGRASALAWDIKYLAAKTLFCIGVGFTLLAAFGHVVPALFLTFSAAFLGFFALRFNHPAFFSLCYSPWILYFWVKLTNTSDLRNAGPYLLGLILADLAVMNSGTVKEAYMLLICINICGFAVLMLNPISILNKLKLLLMASVATLVIIFISTPIWLTFLDALRHSYTGSDIPSAAQIQPSFLIGLFDDIFYRQMRPGETFFNPSVNFFVLLGVLWAAANFPVLVRNRTFLAICLSTLIPFSLSFGLVTPEIIVRIPFLANINHIGNTFSCVLIVHLLMLSGAGINAMILEWNTFHWHNSYILTISSFASLLVLFFGTANQTPVHYSRFFYFYFTAISISFVFLPPLIRRIASFHDTSYAIRLLFTAFLVLLFWRHGMHLSTRFDAYVMNPQQRVDLLATSPAIDTLHSMGTEEPFRVVGMNNNLFPGYNSVVSIEGINGPDALVNPLYRELSKAAGLNAEWGWLVITDWTNLPLVRPVHSMFNVKYYLDRSDPPPHCSTLLNLAGKYDLNIYENPDVWPRAFFTNKLTNYDTIDDFLFLITHRTDTPFAAMQRQDLASQPQLSNLLSSDIVQSVSKASDFILSNNTTQFKIVAPSEGIVVLSEMFLDGDFQVTLNGVLVPYFRANHGFKAVHIPQAGTYELSFSYWPKHFSLSLILSGIGFFFLAAYLLYLICYRLINCISIRNANIKSLHS